MGSTWKTLSGARVEDLPETLDELLTDDDASVHVGTDSKNRGNWTYFVTVIAVPRRVGGGRVLYRSERQPRMRNLAQRLIHEAQLSLELASELNERVTQDVIIHLDVNEDERFRSAQFARSLAGMGLGSGFQVRLKPEAWCASSVADHVVNARHVRVA
ncbi:hypothetical protein Pla163_35220 [Planctomycetes bacterium Pla163]|uniref:Uncharacterized protein n=1 Tax=Rohdeia mirabilis TaxID=2528008 RepID=A0A518D4H2_9BACT|nr:hypothetical protein Pla163_35220 [Planctomycetes bacterium Pla163]